MLRLEGAAGENAANSVCQSIKRKGGMPKNRWEMASNFFLRMCSFICWPR